METTEKIKQSMYRWLESINEDADKNLIIDIYFNKYKPDIIHNALKNVNSGRKEFDDLCNYYNGTFRSNY